MPGALFRDVHYWRASATALHMSALGLGKYPKLCRCKRKLTNLGSFCRYQTFACFFYNYNLAFHSELPYGSVVVDGNTAVKRNGIDVGQLVAATITTIMQHRKDRFLIKNSLNLFFSRRGDLTTIRFFGRRLSDHLI
jgi:hypothetical protein